VVQSSGVNVNGLAFVNIITDGQSVNSMFHWVGWEIWRCTAIYSC
jgi:hypothetical protein